MPKQYKCPILKWLFTLMLIRSRLLLHVRGYCNRLPTRATGWLPRISLSLAWAMFSMRVTPIAGCPLITVRSWGSRSGAAYAKDGASIPDAPHIHSFTELPLAPGLKACCLALQAIINATVIKASSAQGKDSALALLRSRPPMTPPLAMARFHAVVTIA